ncbi:prepilin-type N-terminal cleavage/methylation domain-containing protein [Patescibacteria group bacterium]
MPKASNKGFTLIELLVVIALVGILSTLALANISAARGRSRDAQRKSDLRSIETALRLYYNDNNYYPLSDTTGNILGCGVDGTSVCTWGEQWSVGTTVYMPKLPGDPLSVQSYQYEVLDSGDSFTLSSCLENESDDKGESTTDTTWCPSGWMYQVTL